MTKQIMLTDCWCGKSHDLRNLQEAVASADSGLTFFQCECGTTLTVKTELLKAILLTDRPCRLIINYFSKSGELKCEVKEYSHPLLAMERVNELKAEGIEITTSHYGIYERQGSRPVEITHEIVQLLLTTPGKPTTQKIA